MAAPIKTENGMVADLDGPEGCYLIFEPSSGGRLMLYYSKGQIPSNAIGFWCPGAGRSIQGFKFKQSAGRQELIKGIAVSNVTVVSVLCL